MNTLLRRALARHLRTLALVPAAFAAAVCAAEPEAAPLALEEAERLALSQQPLLEAQRATVRAARERAVAMRQLPDPMLIAGVTNLPVNGEDRYSLSADFMTMTTVGVMQEFPLPGKRRLRGRAEALMADAGDAKLVALERAVRRDTAMAWIEVWFPERAAELAQAMAAEAERERAAAEIAYRSGRAPQADVLAADVELEMLRDRERRLEQQAAQARATLARWTGVPVAASLPAAAPELPDPPALEALLAGLERHPELAEAGFEVAAGENTLALAKQGYWPDWRVEAMYGWRPDFDEMVSVQVGIDLPVFRGSRQDRDAAAAREQLAAGEATREDMARQLRAMATGAHQAWSQARVRLARYDEAIVPRASARAEASLAAYRAGKAELDSVLMARRAALDVSLMRLELQMDVLKQLTELRYLDMSGA
jgi:cobalt-zinc-cadmium efflux system outer membrane protein